MYPMLWGPVCMITGGVDGGPGLDMYMAGGERLSSDVDPRPPRLQTRRAGTSARRLALSVPLVHGLRCKVKRIAVYSACPLLFSRRRLYMQLHVSIPAPFPSPVAPPFVDTDRQYLHLSLLW